MMRPYSRITRLSVALLLFRNGKPAISAWGHRLGVLVVQFLPRD